MRTAILLAVAVCLLPILSACGRVTITSGAVPDYHTDSFVVAPGSYYTVTVVTKMPAGATGTIEGYFLVDGGNNDVDFRVRSPDGTYLENPGRVRDRFQFHYTIHEAGPYTFFFDNGFSLFTGKHVILETRAYALSQ